MVDVIIIGGGPAGLSAAVVLARCRRSVVVIDSGSPRNRRARNINNFLTRDRIKPARFREIGRAEAVRYGAELIPGLVADAARRSNGTFSVRLAGGRTLSSRKLLLATGVVDVLPDIEGFDALYGTSVHHCPYCDGWEHADEPIAAYGKGRAAIGLARLLKVWSDDVVACTDGAPLRIADLEFARECRVALRQEKVTRLEGKGGKLRRVHFASGDPLPAAALFFNTPQYQRSNLPKLLSCQFKANGGIVTSKRQCAGIRGLYVAGDADKDVQFSIVAAGEGATAATAINSELMDDGVEPGRGGR